MIKNREGFLVSETDRECTNCGKIFKKTSKTVTLCPVCNCNRVKCSDPRSKMLARAKSRAKVKGLDFLITISDINIPEFCPVMGCKLEAKKGSPGGQKYSPALDRIDSSKGYIKGNVQVISHIANMMKNNATEQEMLTFAVWVNKNYKL